MCITSSSKPPLTSGTQDVSNFDTVFTEEDPIDSFVEDSNLSKTVQDQFSGMMDIWANMTRADYYLVRIFLQWHCQSDLIDNYRQSQD